MGKHELLFSKGDLGGTLDELAAKARATIKQLDADQLDPQNEDRLLEHLKKEFVVNPLRLHRDNMTREPHRLGRGRGRGLHPQAHGQRVRSGG